MMLEVMMEFRKGILFVRLKGLFNNNTISTFNKEVREVIINTGIKYVVLNFNELEEVSNNAIKEVRGLKKIIKKMDGDLFLVSADIKELGRLVKLENELKVFERVVI